MTRSMRRQRERGSAMLVTLVVIGALLSGAAVLVSLQLSSNRSTDLTRRATLSLYCAEAGLAAARPAVVVAWDPALALVAAQLAADPTATGSEPTWLADPAINHDLTGGTGGGLNPDFKVMIKDNDDEPSGTANDLALDNDMQIYIISTCLKYPETPKQVIELVRYNGGTQCNPNQLGGCSGAGNNN